MTFEIKFEIESLPGYEGPVTLETKPFEMEAGAEPESAESFPPVSQVYQLQEPVQLYELGVSGDFALAELQSFDVIVNPSA